MPQVTQRAIRGRKRRKLQGELARAQQVHLEPTVREVEVPAISDEQFEELHNLLTAYQVAGEELRQRGDQLVAMSLELMSSLSQVRSALTTRNMPNIKEPASRNKLDSSQVQKTVRVTNIENGSGFLSKCERAIVGVLFQHPEGCLRAKLTILAGYAWSGSFQNALGALRTKGYIVGSNSESMRLTAEGRAAVDGAEPLPEDLQKFWLNHPRLGKSERMILSVLINYRDAGLDREGLQSQTGYAWSGSFQNALGKLRTLGLIHGKNSDVMRACEEIW